MTPRAADAVRKACAYALAIGLTLLLLRVMSRLAGGTLAWNDPAIYGAAAFLAVGVLWVRAARRTRTKGPGPPAAPP